MPLCNIIVLGQVRDPQAARERPLTGKGPAGCDPHRCRAGILQELRDSVIYTSHSTKRESKPRKYFGAYPVLLPTMSGFAIGRQGKHDVLAY